MVRAVHTGQSTALIVLGLAFYLCGLHDAVYMLNFVVTFFALAEPAGIGP